MWQRVKEGCSVLLLKFPKIMRKWPGALKVVIERIENLEYKRVKAKLTEPRIADTSVIEGLDGRPLFPGDVSEPGCAFPFPRATDNFSGLPRTPSVPHLCNPQLPALCQLPSASRD